MKAIGLACVLCALLSCSDDNGTPPGDTGGGGDVSVTDQGIPDDQGPLYEQAVGDQGEPGDQGKPGDQGQPQPDGAVANCDPMDAKGVGACDMVLGVTWDGKQCISISGCSCGGTDCSKLFNGPTDCLTSYTTCLCRPMDAKGDGACKMLLGWIWDGKQCMSIGGCTCIGTDCKKLYSGMKECQQAHAGLKCP